jgi:hypothetical protein
MNKKKIIVVLFISFAALMLVFYHSSSINISLIKNEIAGKRHVFYSGNMVDITIDSVLYETPMSKNFFVKFFIRNKTLKTIGVDLSDYWKLIYPNQWGVYDTNYRMVIDEGQIIPDTLDMKKKDKMKKFFKAGEMNNILTGKTISYYREFNAGGKKDITIKQGKYLIISLDGVLHMTDGENFESVFCNGKSNVNRELVIKYPLKWATIPENSLVFQE